VGAKDVIDAATPLVLDAIRRMPDTGTSNSFTFTDMGCADGGTSIDLVRQAVRAVRARWPQRPITVVYSDQPRNDYNSLFHLIHGLTPIRTYLDEIEDVYVLAAATSFYRPILPARTLNLGFSATAMHWLSRKPCDLTNHVQAVGAEGAELAAFAEQGRRDWETILLQRARELVPSGRLVLINFGKDESGRYLGNTGGVNMFDTFNLLWQRFAAEGVISADEYLRMTLPQYTRRWRSSPTRLLTRPARCIGRACGWSNARRASSLARLLLSFVSTARLRASLTNTSRHYGRGLRVRFSQRSRRPARWRSVRALSIATTAPTRR
jgi:hypothetical protein